MPVAGLVRLFGKDVAVAHEYLAVVSAAGFGLAAGDGYAQGVAAGTGRAQTEHGRVVVLGVGFDFSTVGRFEGEVDVVAVVIAGSEESVVFAGGELNLVGFGFAHFGAALE